MAPDFDHPHTPRGRMFLWAGIGLGVLLLIVLLTRGFGLFASSGGQPEAPGLVHQGDEIILPPDSILRKEIAVAPARDESGSARLELPAVVESEPTRTAAVLTPLAGRVTKIAVSLGDRVTRGQVLTLIDSPDLAQANDDYDKAADALSLTKKNLTRQEAQFKIGAASSRDLDQARSDYAQALAEYTRARNRLIAIGAPTNTTHASSELEVKAPVGGSLTALTIATGNMINDPTQPIMTVADLTTVWVTAMVPEKDVSAVHKNDDAEVRLEAYPDRTFHGKVLFVPDVVEPDTRRIKIRIALENPDYTLKPNMFGTVVLHGAHAPRIVLPTSALLMNNDRTTVFVERAPWRFERRIVAAQLQEGDSVVITSGLKAGERVVVKGGILLND